ncbi:unnamed protein product [Parnassius apollo]|uniref:(apollo) hypothetical protein n=1 Tax=Parnassius apollo TaxID=110799 RepID=A0A8S3YCA1_PARAO|nr:unnamed protein product [Parnassius apollo]
MLAIKVSESTARRLMKKLGFTYITPRPADYKQDKNKQEEFKKNLNEIVEKNQQKEVFLSMNRDLEQTQKLDMDGLKRAQEHKLKKVKTSTIKKRAIPEDIQQVLQSESSVEASSNVSNMHTAKYVKEKLAVTVENRGGNLQAKDNQQDPHLEVLPPVSNSNTNSIVVIGIYIENGGEEALLHEISKKKPLMANRVSEDIERAVVNIATEFPAYGQQRASNELRKRDLRRWKQLAALEKVKEQREAHGEIETEHPGYLSSQDTYYVEGYKNSKLSLISIQELLWQTDKTITAGDLLNDRAIPFFDGQNVPLSCILTDRGCGKPENHSFICELKILIIQELRPILHKLMAYTRGFIKICVLQ